MAFRRSSGGHTGDNGFEQGILSRAFDSPKQQSNMPTHATENIAAPPSSGCNLPENKLGKGDLQFVEATAGA
jgi:hypothetical protein